MDTQKLLAKPKEQPQVVAKVTKINSLAKATAQTNKSSRILRRTFERGIYQRKTQLSILNRYKKRLDSINKEQDKRISKRAKKEKPKFNIPKFKGSFFTPGSADDPLKAIGALAAFNALERMIGGDIMGGIMGPGMIAAASLLGPGLLGMGADALLHRGAKPTKGFDATGRRVSTSTQQRYLQRYGDKAFKNRFGNDALKRTQQGTEVVSNVGKGARAAKAFGRFGAALIPGVGAVVGAADAAVRAQSGDQFGAALSGTAATLDAAAAASAATGIGLPVAGLLSIASFALDATNLVRDLTGMSAAEEEKNKNKDRLKKQEKKQKELQKGKGNLTFATTLLSYEKALVKFEEFSKQFTGFKTPEEQKAEDQRMASQIENAGGGGSNPLSGPGYEFTKESSFAQYLTGDPNSQGYDYYHGTTSNYHDHLAFNDRGTAERAYNFLKGKGLQVTEFKGYDTVGGHSQGSAHYSGLAFDVPGAQWGGSGAIGQKEYSGSAKVRAFMNDFFRMEKSRQQQGSNEGGIVSGPQEGYPHLLHGTEAVIPIDNYHTASGGDPLKNISSEILNLIAAKSKKYQTTMADMPPEVIKVPIPIPPPQIQYVSTGSGSLNIQNDSDKNILRMLYYNSLG